MISFKPNRSISIFEWKKNFFLLKKKRIVHGIFLLYCSTVLQCNSLLYQLCIQYWNHTAEQIDEQKIKKIQSFKVVWYTYNICYAIYIISKANQMEL